MIYPLETYTDNLIICINKHDVILLAEKGGEAILQIMHLNHYVLQISKPKGLFTGEIL